MTITAGFWSYVHDDDRHENGRITHFRERLEQSIRFYSGIRNFRIFQDRKDIGWGEKWATRIADSLDDTLLLFSVITPSYFSSKPCQEEVLAFQTRQAKIGREDLILPIYYLAADLMDGAGHASTPEEHQVAALLTTHQYEDWRSLRITEETDPSYGKAIERLAQQAAKALKRGRSAETKRNGFAELSTSVLDNKAVEQGGGGTSEPSPATSASAPGHVMTVTVSPMPGRAQFTSISEAIARAPGGARILVFPGRYQESVVIDKPLELIGDGPREDIVIEASKSETLIFDTNIGFVRNFTLRQSQIEAKNYCLWIKQGRLELEDCDISSSGYACLGVSNNADPRVRRNRIHHSNQSGIFVHEQARGTYEDNEIFSNINSGIQVSERGEPVVRRNRIYANETGIMVRNGGRGTFEDNEILQNKFAAVEVKLDGDPLVRRNRVYDGQQSGVYVHTHGRGTYEDNDIFGNAIAGVHSEAEGNPIVRYNRINRNGHEGVWIGENGAGSFADNVLTDNTRGPWDIHKSALKKIRRERNREK